MNQWIIVNQYILYIWLKLHKNRKKKHKKTTQGYRTPRCWQKSTRRGFNNFVCLNSKKQKIHNETTLFDRKLNAPQSDTSGGPQIPQNYTRKLHKHKQSESCNFGPGFVFSCSSLESKKKWQVLVRALLDGRALKKPFGTLNAQPVMLLRPVSELSLGRLKAMVWRSMTHVLGRFNSARTDAQFEIQMKQNHRDKGGNSEL